VISLSWDKAQSRTHTFLFLLEKDSWKHAYTKTIGNTCFVAYFPDSTALDQVVKNFQPPAERDFDIQLKGYPGAFSFENPRRPGEITLPELNSDSVLKIVKFSVANGVNQTVEVFFRYDEKNLDNPIVNEKVIFSFEKDISNDESGDPLEELRARRRETIGRRTSVLDPTRQFLAESVIEENTVFVGEDAAVGAVSNGIPRKSMVDGGRRKSSVVVIRNQEPPADYTGRRSLFERPGDMTVGLNGNSNGVVTAKKNSVFEKQRERKKSAFEPIPEKE
jgi:hypothetical protein